MRDQIAKYSAKMLRDRTADPQAMAWAVLDDALVAEGAQELLHYAAPLLERLGMTALVAARPPLPFGDLLIASAPPGESRLVPRDTETLTFLHDIPFLRRKELESAGLERLAAMLASRKGVLVEGLGIFATGAVTVEQAYVNYSSIFHALFVHFLSGVLRNGIRSEEERAAVETLRRWLILPEKYPARFDRDALEEEESALEEMVRTGRYTVEAGLVDSVFGNISFRTGETIHISQTGSSLDELGGCIDPVPEDDSSTAGITASSELPAHRRIYRETGARTILHGHPRFAVIMSMACEQQGCTVSDCWRACPHVRILGTTPVVAGEVGAGGLAEKVAPVIGKTGSAIVFGHGVFAVGRQGFEEPFRALVEVESWCRDEFFRRIGFPPAVQGG